MATCKRKELVETESVLVTIVFVLKLPALPGEPASNVSVPTERIPDAGT